MNKYVSLGVAYALHIEQGTREIFNFPFDKCRWQVEEGDVGVAHEEIADHHLFLTSRLL